MKSLWKCISLLSILALLLAACAQVTPPPAQVKKETVIVNQPVKETIKETVVVKETVEVPAAAPIVPAAAPAIPNPVVTAVKVAEIPALDANWAPPGRDNATWKDVPATQIGGMQWQAAYTDKDFALLLKWIDPDLTMNAPGNYLWDPAKKSWSQISGLGSWGPRQQEWMNLAWDINSVQLAEGCNAFCHEDPPGSGNFHHQTASTDQSSDSWMLMGKHGWNQMPGEGGVQGEADFGLPSGGEDKGWMMGNIQNHQEGPVTFDASDPLDTRIIVSGNVTFVDYAEDNIIVAHGDPTDAERNRPRDLYCKNCHAQIKLPYDPLELDLTRPDDGAIKYSPNWKTPYTAPEYIETKPAEFVDAMVLTQVEVDNGEAVKVADLTPDQISQYWANYKAVNGLVPPLVLKTPDGSMSDVLMASNWNNGVWTMEIHRALVTPNGPDDVQFDDLGKDYYFSLTISNSDILLGPNLGEYGGILEFKQ